MSNYESVPAGSWELDSEWQGNTATVSIESTVNERLTARYALDSGSGSTAIDGVGGNDGSTSGASWTTSAEQGSHALAFDGGDEGAISHSTAIETPGSWSAMTWMNASKLPSSLGDDARFADKGNDFVMRLDDEGDHVVISKRDSSGSNVKLDSGYTPNTSQWYHVAVTKGPDGSKLYVDGELEDTTVTLPRGQVSIVIGGISDRSGSAPVGWEPEPGVAGSNQSSRIAPASRGTNIPMSVTMPVA
ncbi:hypothetical protein BRD17_01845 [Halobacteriales archaeon SW_7_68_16]|nr:MAG: hypothetical protein BRD17_01845 [Halobacteriales archaeon SW_7_68_16]